MSLITLTLNRILRDRDTLWQDKEVLAEELREECINLAATGESRRAMLSEIDARMKGQEARPWTGKGCTSRNDNPTYHIPDCYRVPKSTERRRRRA